MELLLSLVRQHLARGEQVADDLIAVAGTVVSVGFLVIERARVIASVLAHNSLDYARLIECRSQADGKETIIAEVDIARPQKRVHNVQAVETIAIVFFTDDRRPEVLSLRRDFPQVPHLNLSPTEYPRSLCLYEQDWSELKARWTPVRFIERIRFWFAETARGSLHKQDQPLEPLIVGSGYQIVVPHDLFTVVETGVKPLNVRFAGDDEKSKLLLARWPKGHERTGALFVAIVVQAEAQTHGVIRSSPSTLNELHEYLSAAGCDLLGKLRSNIDLWANEAAKNARLLVVAVCPKRRDGSATVEASDVWTFVTLSTVEEVLIDIGRLGKVGSFVGPMLGEGDATKQGHSIQLEVLRTTFSYSRETAAYLNGLDAPDQQKVVAVGLGALGSKLQLSLARAGFGRWTLVDDDVLLPHNLARHQYSGIWTGTRKVDVARIATQSFFGDEEPPESISANVCRPGDEEPRLLKALVEADLILDMSASVTASRCLAAINSGARRLSIFFNPAGTEVVLLAEDQGRVTRLDALEFQFYRGLLNQPELESHLVTDIGRVRYAASCRDVTSQVPDDQVSLLAAIGARAVRMAASDPAAQVRIWKLDTSTFEVTSLRVPVAEVTLEELGGWTLILDEALRDKLKELRKKKLPNETGGILLGFFNHEARRVYVIDTIPSPPDSEEWPTIYIRGSEMLGQELERVSRVTAGNVEYVGEWHSHPEGSSCRPSRDDIKVFGWLTAHMADEGQPALMAIVGDQGPTFYLGEIPNSRGECSDRTRLGIPMPT